RDTSATCEPKTVSDILLTAEKGQAQRLPFFFWGTDHVFFELRQKRLAGLEEKRGLSPCYPYRRPRTTGNPGARRRAACRRFVIRRTFLRGLFSSPSGSPPLCSAARIRSAPQLAWAPGISLAFSASS